MKQAVLEKALSFYEIKRQAMQAYIQEHCDFEIFVQHQSSDGHMVMSEAESVGMGLDTVLDIIKSGNRLTIDNWKPFG